MKLDRVFPESKIFIDTNIFLYDITGHPEFGLIIKNFLTNIELGLFQGKTSIIVLNELLHKHVIGEIAEKYRLKLFQVPAFIKQDPTVLSNLTNDAIIAATCNIHNINNIASNDGDFGRVDFLVRWNP